MSGIIKKNTDSPDDSGSFNLGKWANVAIGGIKIQHIVLEPGWKWSKDNGPNAGTESCQMEHYVYGISGKVLIRMDDGSEEELGPRDYAYLPPGHDAWVVGDEPYDHIAIILEK